MSLPPSFTLLPRLWDATLVGSVLVLAALGLQALFRHRIPPRWLTWIWLVAALRFLLPAAPFSLAPVGFPLPALLPATASAVPIHPPALPGEAGPGISPAFPTPAGILGAVWLAGVAVSAVAVGLQAWRLHRRLRRKLSTDHELLELLESAKERLDIHIPIGLIVVEEIGSPMIVGWLRPRIVLPGRFAGEISHAELSRIFVHELAHFKTADIPVLWLATAVRVVHWFNPLAYLVGSQLRARQEEACDTLALRVLGDSPESYGQTLLRIVRLGRPARSSWMGNVMAAASFSGLRGRLTLLANRRPSSSFLAATALAGMTLAGLATTRAALPPETDESAHAARQAALTWLDELDRGDYADNWRDASERFRTTISPSSQWKEQADKLRESIGAVRERRFSTQTYLPVSLQGIEGPYFVFVFQTRFEKLPQALETVTFVRDPDGKWRAIAYFVRASS